MEKQWALSPGEKREQQNPNVYAEVDQLHEEFTSLVEAYKKKSKYGRVIVMNDCYEVVFFLNFKDESSPIGATDAAFYDGSEYQFAPRFLSERIANKYLSYINELATIREYMEEGQG